MSETAQAKATHASPQQRELPSGWRWVRLGEVCEKQTGIRDPRNKPDTAFQYVDITSVSNVQKCITEAQTVFGKDAPSRARQVMRANDIIVATTRPNLNAVAQVPFELDNQICSTGFCVLRTGVDILPDYLFAFVRYGSFIEALTDLVKGALYPAVNDSQVKSQQIPLPPLSVQQRISGLLREQMVTVEKARAAAQTRLDAIKALPAAFLRQAFPQPGQSLPDGWRWVKLGEVIEIVSGQVDPKESRYRELPHVNGGNIESGTGRLLTIRSAAEDLMTSGKYYFEAGVVLYSKLRPYLKKAAIADFRGLCSADMYPILPKHDELTLSFLLQILLSEPFTTYAESESQRARMPKLNRDQLFAYAAPLPPLPEQKQIAAILREQMSVVEKARAAAQEELKTINALPAALLRQAFNGEL